MQVSDIRCEERHRWYTIKNLLKVIPANKKSFLSQLLLSLVVDRGKVTDFIRFRVLLGGCPLLLGLLNFERQR